MNAFHKVYSNILSMINSLSSKKFDTKLKEKLEKNLIVFSAYCLGTISLEMVVKWLELESPVVAQTLFNEWLTVMPKFVQSKWNGYHKEDMEF